MGALDSESMDEDDLLEEQRAFYRARAPEYDDWWQRRGRYDRGGEMAVEWNRQVAEVAAALDSFTARGDVLELAGGTGWWTQRLSKTADRLTVVDASIETLRLNRERVGRPDVNYIVADLFSWEPDRVFDVVFFSFWLSHVPRARFTTFWGLVRSCLAADGRVFFIDNRDDSAPTMPSKDPYVVEYGPDLQLRWLADGSEYRVVKVMYEPAELEALLAEQGWAAHVSSTRWFVFGNAKARHQ
jgi:demethylmenaquinone methyltransferase/2-methoxy-6-polyprenyl-1,4-benzoquinol methylase